MEIQEFNTTKTKTTAVVSTVILTIFLYSKEVFNKLVQALRNNNQCLNHIYGKTSKMLPKAITDQRPGRSCDRAIVLHDNKTPIQSTLL